MADTSITAYGVWVRGQGWLKVGEKDRFADENRAVAESAASFFGARACVRPIDDALILLEAVLLEAEQSALERFAKRVKAWRRGQQ